MKKTKNLAGERVAFLVRLQPRASRDEIVGWDKVGHLRIRVTAPPVDDSANRNLVVLLSKFLRVPRTDVVITSGHHFRSKRITVPQACENRLLSVADI